MQGNYHPDLGERVSSWDKMNMERSIISHLLLQPSVKQKGLRLLTKQSTLLPAKSPLKLHFPNTFH